MRKIILVILLLVTSLSAANKCGNSETISMKKLQHKKAVNSYVSSISKKIAKKLGENMPIYKKASLRISIMPITHFNKPKKVSIATQKISENLLHQMFSEGFQVVSDTQHKVDARMLGTYINYKKGMLINARVVDSTTGIIYSSAQVFVSKKELKSINKIYDKYDWFSQ